MRILQVFNRYLERGGEEASVERISNILSEHHKVFHCYFDSQMWKYETSLWSLIKQAGMMLWNPDATKRFNRHIEACKPDLILIHNVFPVGSLSILNAATKLQIPVAYVIHNFRPFSVNGYLWADGKILPQGLNLDFFPEIFCGSWQNSRTKTALLAFVILTAHSLGIYRKIDCWLAISEFMRSNFISAGLPKEKVHLLRHSWNAHTAESENLEIQAPPPIPYLLFLGRLTESKGLQVMLMAWSKVVEKVQNAKLLIAGSGPMEEELRTALHELPRCEYLGQVDGRLKQQLLSQTTALIVPSVWWEPLGLVVYEAYDSSKPVLIARSGGLTETVIDGETGWIHEPGNATQLAEHMIDALERPEVSHSRGMAGRQWLQKHASPTDWLKQFEQIANHTIRQKKSPQKKETRGLAKHT